MNSLTIKVTDSCNAACYHCTPRVEFYESQGNQGAIDTGTLTALLDNPLFCSLSKISFSGGEPTLVSHLPKLCKIARLKVSQLTINTNGSNSSSEFWEMLIESGVTNVNISLDSGKERLQDWLRNKRGLYKSQLRLLRVLKELKLRFPILSISVVSILSNFNLLELDDLFEMIIKNKCDRWVIHYPECDDQAIFVPTVNKIHLFRGKILPKLKTLAKAHLGNIVNVERLLRNIYSPDLLCLESVSSGVYWPLSKVLSERPCHILGNFVLFLRDGRLMPCPGADYGSLNPIGAITGNDKLEVDTQQWNQIIREKVAYCCYCPVPEQIKIPMRY